MKRSDFFKTFLGGVLASKVKVEEPKISAFVRNEATSAFTVLRGDGTWAALPDQYWKGDRTWQTLENQKALDNLLTNRNDNESQRPEKDASRH